MVQESNSVTNSIHLKGDNFYFGPPDYKKFCEYYCFCFFINKLIQIFEVILMFNSNFFMTPLSLLLNDSLFALWNKCEPNLVMEL